MNYFYGKPINTLTTNELTLLSLDIDINNGRKNGMITNQILSELNKVRLRLAIKCMDDGGDYSTIRFQEDFNGEGVNELQDGFVECEVLPNLPISLN